MTTGMETKINVVKIKLLFVWVIHCLILYFILFNTELYYKDETGKILPVSSIGGVGVDEDGIFGMYLLLSLVLAFLSLFLRRVHILVCSYILIIFLIWFYYLEVGSIFLSISQPNGFLYILWLFSLPLLFFVSKYSFLKKRKK